MNQLSTLKMALMALWINKVRSVLTLLGIVIGISAVVVIIASGEGVQQFVLNQIQSFGTNVMSVMPGGSEDDRMGPPAAVMGVTVTTLTMDDMYAIGDSRNVPDVLDVGAASSATQVVIPGIEDDVFATLYGVSPSYFSISNMDFIEGDGFTEDDVKGISTVTVLGSTIKEKLFGDDSAVGQKVKLGNHRYRVVGVLEGGTTFGMDMGKMVYVPVTTAQKLLLGVDYVTEIMVRVTSEDRIEAARVDVQNVLRDRHHITDAKNDDFTIRTIKDALTMIQLVMGALTLFLAAIAGISLLVGGIGIMNIMLVSVTERTREIGLRKAIGARRLDILAQFLAESVVISAVGGLCGVLVGWLIVKLITLAIGWSTSISWPAVFLALLFSGAIGIVFGLYPARKASFLNPIDALRYE